LTEAAGENSNNSARCSMNKEITIITNYFPPETGAASNRIFELAKALAMKSYAVTVVCPLPSYPRGKIFNEYKGKFIKKETNGNLTIYRLWHVPSNSRSKILRLLSMLSFCFSLFWFLLFKKLSPTFFIQLSPLFVGFTAVCLARLKRKKIVLNVSDLWPLAGLEMNILSKGFYYRVLEFMEHFSYKKADLICGQSQEILDHVHKITPSKNLFLYRNLPQIDLPNHPAVDSASKGLKIVYAGLLGVAQGVFQLIQNLNLPEGVTLSIYGDGPEAKQIKKWAEQQQQINFYGSLSRKELHRALLTYNLAIVPLKNSLYGSVPSKIFELSNLGIPMVYLSGGEGASIVEQYKLGFVIRESDYTSLSQLISDLHSGKLILPSSQHLQAVAKEYFSFGKQFEAFLVELNKV